jgi:hypothetical protein
MLLAVMPLPTVEGKCGQLGGFSHVKGGDAILTPRGRASAHDDVLHALVDGAGDAHALHGASSLAAVAPADQKHKDESQVRLRATLLVRHLICIRHPPRGQFPAHTHAHSAHGGIHSARRGSRDERSNRWTLGRARGWMLRTTAGSLARFLETRARPPEAQVCPPRRGMPCTKCGVSSHPSMLADFLTADINLSLQKSRSPARFSASKFPAAGSASPNKIITAVAGH